MTTKPKINIPLPAIIAIALLVAIALLACDIVLRVANTGRRVEIYQVIPIKAKVVNVEMVNC